MRYLLFVSFNPVDETAKEKDTPLRVFFEENLEGGRKREQQERTDLLDRKLLISIWGL